MDPSVYAIRQRAREMMGHRVEPQPRSSCTGPRPATVFLIRPPENCENREPKVFAYDPLPTPTSIRLLQVHPEKLRNEFDIYIPPRCTLVVRDLDDKPIYDALSYTWGSPVTVYSNAREVSSETAWASPAFDIICNGKPFSVTTNLYTALLSLRTRFSEKARRYVEKISQHLDSNTTQSVSPTLHIWIDQICINQSDLKERNAQVMLMRRIYKQAQKVPIWLGGEDQFSRTGIETMMKLSAMTSEMAPKLLRADILSTKTFESIGMEPIGPREWIALYAFFSRSWFRRSWVVQEAALAQKLTFCCGLLVFTLDPIGHVMEMLMESDWIVHMAELAQAFQGHSNAFDKEVELIKAEDPDISLYQPNRDDLPNPSILRHLLGLRIGHFGFSSTHFIDRNCKSDRLSLSTVLDQFQDLRATNPRDKIYAFLALAEELGQAGALLPSYEKPVAEVFRESMQFMLWSSNSLSDLSMKEDPRRTKIPNLESWVPDFTSDRQTSLRTHVGSSPWFAAGHLGQTHMIFRPNGVLEARGLCIGTARAVHDLSGLMDLGVGDGHRSLLNVVQALPEHSSVWIPCITPSLRLYLKTSGMVPNKDFYHQALIEEEGTVARQSRFEVFWRTLLTDCFGSEFPPPTRTADLLLGCWESALQLRMIAAGSCSDPESLIAQAYGSFGEIQRMAPSWDVLRSSMSEMFRAQMFLKDQQSHEIQDQAFPEEITAILPELDSAWAGGRVSAKGQNMAQGIMNIIKVDFTTEELAFKKRAEYVCLKKRLFATNEGQLGLGPESTREGDETWVLAGADTPFVLRPQEDGRYTLLGEAYVHGAMFRKRHQGDSDFVAEDIKTVLLA